MYCADRALLNRRCGTRDVQRQFTFGSKRGHVIKLPLALMLFMSTAAAAAPSVFVQSAQGRAFWNSEKNIGRVMETQAGLVTAKALTKFIDENRAYYEYEVCNLTAVTPDTYVGVDKAAADEMAQFDQQGMTNYRVAATTPDGRPVVGQAVLFESCDGDLKGAGVLTYDARSNEVLMFEEITSSEEPYWFVFLQPNTDKTDSKLFSYSPCLECGASTAVYFDVTRKRVYTEYNGH